MFFCFCYTHSLSHHDMNAWAGIFVLAHFHPCRSMRLASVFYDADPVGLHFLFSSSPPFLSFHRFSLVFPSCNHLSFPSFSFPPLLSTVLLSSLLLLPLHHLFLAPIPTYSASKATRGSGWVATSFSFPLMLSSHSAVACSVRAEQTPGSPPEASARRSPPLPAHLREPSEWSAIVLAVIWWLHSTGRQSQEPGGSPHLTGCDEALLIFFLLFC